MLFNQLVGEEIGIHHGPEKRPFASARYFGLGDNRMLNGSDARDPRYRRAGDDRQQYADSLSHSDFTPRSHPVADSQ
jgi:hypothetical protein